MKRQEDSVMSTIQHLYMKIQLWDFLTRKYLISSCPHCQSKLLYTGNNKQKEMLTKNEKVSYLNVRVLLKIAM